MTHISSFINEAKVIYNAAEQTYIKDSFSTSGTQVYARSSDGVKCSKELDLSGREDISYYIEIDSAGNFVKYYLSDGSFQYQNETYGLKKTDINDVDNVAEITSYERFSINCDGTVEISDTRVATTITGQNINKKMKKLSGQESAGYGTVNSTITSFKKWPNRTMPNGVSTEKISTTNSDTPIYIWFDNGTIYYFSETKNVVLNTDMSYLFHSMQGLTAVSGLLSFDTSEVKNMLPMFSDCKGFVTLDLKGFDTSSATNMSYMFEGCTSLQSIDVSEFVTE